MRPDGPLIIAVDGSAHSDQTLRWGLATAELHGADVVIARAYLEPYDYAQWTWYPPVADMRFDLEVAEYLNALHERASTSHPHLAISTRALHGFEVPVLRALTDDARMLVVGAHGYGSRARTGRVSSHLAAHARCPVAVVRDPEDASGPVVVGVDGSLSSLTAADAAAREAAARQADLVILHARPTTLASTGVGLAPPVATADQDDPTHRAAQKTATSLRAAHPGLVVRSELVDDDPAHALIDASVRARLVVVGSRGLGAFRGMLLGSVSRELVRRCASTLLVVHRDTTGPRAADDDGEG